MKNFLFLSLILCLSVSLFGQDIVLKSGETYKIYTGKAAGARAELSAIKVKVIKPLKY